MQETGRTVKWQVIALLAAGVSGASALFLMPHEKLLLVNAIPVCNLRDLNLSSGGDDFYWINDTQLLLLRSSPPASSQKIQDWTLARYDIATHTKTALPAIARNANQIPGNLEELTISPDGKYLLWLNIDSRVFYASVVSLDGAHPLTWHEEYVLPMDLR